MDISFAKQAYRAVLPQQVRQTIWNIRHGFPPSYNPCRTEEFEKHVDTEQQLLQFQCDICGSSDIGLFNNPVTGKLSYKFYQCRACDFIFVHPKPVPEETYTDGPFVDMGQGAAPAYNHYLRAIEKYTSKKGNLLEIGFGDAGFLLLAHRAGWHVHGIELSVPCVRNAVEQLKLPNIAHGTLDAVGYKDGYFDVVSAFNFIEHVPDLKGTLESIRRILRPNGLLVSVCPNMGGIYHRLIPELFGERDPLNISWVPPYHVSYFNKDNFKLLLENSGFKVIGDESQGTNILWLYHEATYGTKTMSENLRSLLRDINNSENPPGEARVAEFCSQIVNQMRGRLVWALATDLIPLESALGSENAIMYIAQKR